LSVIATGRLLERVLINAQMSGFADEAEILSHRLGQTRQCSDALDAGYPSEVAESMLHALEEALRIFEKHRQLVLDQLKRRPSE